MHIRSALSLGLALGVAPFALSAASSWPAPKVVPMLDSNKVANGPAIPTTPPSESAHPASIALWPNGAPGSEARKDEPEQISYRQEADIVFPILFNVHNPSITPFLPAKGKATGAAVIVAPGGGNMFHTIDREGYDVGRWLADHGVAAFVLKYRLARDTANMATNAPQPYKADEHAAADGSRAIRYVRAHAAEFGVNPDRIGIMGFSAGGAVVLNAISKWDAGKPDAADPVERVSSRPNFSVPIYTSGFTRIESTLNKDTTGPIFMLCAVNDSMPDAMAAFLTVCRKAGVNVELHIFNSGGHGFGVRSDRTLSVGGWPNLFIAWLNDRGFTKK